MLSFSVRAEAADVQSKAGAVTTASGSLNVRAQPNSGASAVAALKKGSYITLISRSGTWWKVEYAKGKYGYCHADYITVVEGTPVTVKADALNVRSGGGTAYTRIATLTKGETVIFLRESGGWSRVLYHGSKTGYVSAEYLSNYVAAVSLRVPSFKQMDLRWGEVLIGESGRTMAQIGCATTAIAMMESYRTGTTITPDAMTTRLTYTVSGSVYWPYHYKTVTNVAGYLSGIYTRLKQGIPVMLGCQDAYGKQHWVVITGFSGGTSIHASGFSILDPGTYSRTDLQQFLNMFPTFYKYLYY